MIDPEIRYWDLFSIIHMLSFRITTLSHRVEHHLIPLNASHIEVHSYHSNSVKS